VPKDTYLLAVAEAAAMRDVDDDPAMQFSHRRKRGEDAAIAGGQHEGFGFGGGAGNWHRLRAREIRSDLGRLGAVASPTLA
jgi:hypothetical protein